MRKRERQPAGEGHQGWDEYAPFYDWENARTLGKRDVPFWLRLTRQRLQSLPAREQRLLELGCGTGRVTIPLTKSGAVVVGLDRSQEMLARARKRRRSGAHLVRGDIRDLPFPASSFPLVVAPYGVLQSLLLDRDLRATLTAIHTVLRSGGTFGLELVADLATWQEYSDRVTIRGQRANGTRVRLIESVRQDRQRRLVLFDQTYEERRGRVVTRQQFSLRFRTLSVRQMTTRLQGAGFTVTAHLGDYNGGPWDPRADAWIILAQKQ